MHARARYARARARPDLAGLCCGCSRGGHQGNCSQPKRSARQQGGAHCKHAPRALSWQGTPGHGCSLHRQGCSPLDSLCGHTQRAQHYEETMARGRARSEVMQVMRACGPSWRPSAHCGWSVTASRMRHRCGRCALYCYLRPRSWLRLRLLRRRPRLLLRLLLRRSRRLSFLPCFRSLCRSLFPPASGMPINCCNNCSFCSRLSDAKYSRSASLPSLSLLPGFPRARRLPSSCPPPRARAGAGACASSSSSPVPRTSAHARTYSRGQRVTHLNQAELGTVPRMIAPLRCARRQLAQCPWAAVCT